MAARSLAAFFLFGAVDDAAAHGWVSDPPARNDRRGDKNGYCPQCGNGNGICGDGNQWPRGSNYVNFYDGPVVTWNEGTIVAVDVRVTAHHKGHYEFSLCDQVINSDLPNAQECLDKHILERATAEEAGITDCQPGDSRAVCQPVDPRHKERYYLPPGSSFDKIYLKLPAGFRCEACTMQWRWWTANSCIPATDYQCFAQELEAAGYSASGWGLGNACPGGGCDRCGCGEEFRNCVDVKITSAGGGGNTPAPTSTTTPFFPTPTTRTTTTMASSTWPVSTTTSPHISSCEAVLSNGKTYGATNDKCNKACAVVPAGVWPCKSGGPCKCGGASPTVAPTAFPTPAPTPAPTPSGGSSGCRANPAMISSRGVSDSWCRRCAEGYRWWPCNDATLCIGDDCGGR